MTQPRGIILFGANGSGKTTIGRELAQMLGCKFMDIEDYHFLPSDVPYTKFRSREDCIALMLSDIRKYENFVLTAVTGDFGDELAKYYALAVHLSAPEGLRMDRIDKRARDQHHERVLEGGDMHESHKQFMDFAKNRPLSKIDDWEKSLQCPVVHMEGTGDANENAQKIAAMYNKIS